MQDQPKNPETETAADSSAAPEPVKAAPPVVASLILLYGGSQGSKRIPGARRQYQFFRVPGIGPNGAPAHVRNYSDMATFHAEELDIRLGRAPVAIVTRLGEASAEDRVRESLAAVIASPLGSPAQKRETLRALIAPALEVIGKEAKPEPVAEVPADPVQAVPSLIDVSKRKAREQELRRAGEPFIVEVLNEYGIDGVAKLNNLPGILAAVLQHEEAAGKFDAEPAPATTPAVTAFKMPNVTMPGITIPEPVAVQPPPAGQPVRYSEAELTKLEINKLREVGALHGITTGTRKAMVQSILAKQGA